MYFLLIPITYIICLIVLFVTKKQRGLAISLIFCALAIAIELWAIMLSRSSTAAIGVLLLPFVGVLAGVLGWAFCNLQVAKHIALRLLGWLCLVGALSVFAFEVNQVLDTVKLNQMRDAEHQARSARISRNHAIIASMLAQNKGRETAAIEQSIREKSNDSEFLLAALANEFVTAETLDHYAHADELSITLTVLRNPNCSADTLARIYRTHSHPDYYFQTLASNANTPAEILREIYQKPRTITGLDIWFAKNPATPADILLTLSKTKDTNVIQSLLQNPNFDCKWIAKIERNIKQTAQPDGSYNMGRLTELKNGLCRLPANIK
ncbi:MAG: hypothetical protein Q8M99_04900 [Methylotenera sp.]|nr:hypothetical protein [Methylotenera sp.]